MDPTLVGTIITACTSLLATFAGIVVSSRLSNYRIQELEKKVDKHNQLIERTYKLEEKDKLVDLELSNLKEKVNELAKDVHKFNNQG